MLKKETLPKPHKARISEGTSWLAANLIGRLDRSGRFVNKSMPKEVVSSPTMTIAALLDAIDLATWANGAAHWRAI